jgi:hypothetical protein
VETLNITNVKARGHKENVRNLKVNFVSSQHFLTAVGIRCADHVTPLYPQKLALTSPTGGGRSVGIGHSRTKAMEFLVSQHFNWQ